MNPAVSPALDLRDIHAAAAVGIWPPAPGWWVLALLALLAVLLAVVWLRRQLRQRRDRAEIMAELDELSHCVKKEGSAHLVASLSTLLRRIALRRYSRDRVAPLTGHAWLQFLDDTGGGGEFTRGAGQILAEGGYKPDGDELQLEPLLALSRKWVQHNLERPV